MTARLFACAALVAVLATGAQAQEAPKTSVEPLLATAETNLGQPIFYPSDSPAKVTAVIITLPPGASSGWHRHPVPLFGYMLAGELTVSYKGAGERIYRPGDALMEAVDTPHDGRNTGETEVRILAVIMGVEGIPNSEKVE
jgi:quercetin dioxygenase-like cupin family protein